MSRSTAAVDWHAIEALPEFRELQGRRRRFVVPATIFFLSWYVLFVLLAGYAEDFMGSEMLVDGLTVGYLLALTQFLMVWGLGWAYLRYSARVLDPLRERVVAQATELAERGEIDTGGAQLTGSRAVGT
jgi:uncharacterized membrane protein (DUF485 family)